MKKRYKKRVYLLVALFSWVHVYRDLLQIKGVDTWFTRAGHVWHAPQYELHGMVVFISLGLVCLYLGLR